MQELDKFLNINSMTSHNKILPLCIIIVLSSVFCGDYPSCAQTMNAETIDHIKKAKTFVDKSLYKQAKTELEIGLKEDPNNIDILSNLGSINLRLSQNYKNQEKNDYLTQARKYFTEVLKLDNKFAPAWNGLADSYYLSGNTSEAISDYQKALLLSSSPQSEWLTNLANAQRDIGQINDAEKNYIMAIRIKPQYAPAYNGYAELLLNKGDLRGANIQIIKAIKIKPDYAMAYYNLGIIKTEQGQKDEAFKAYLMSLRLEKNPVYVSETQELIDKIDKHKSISESELTKFQKELTGSDFKVRKDVTSRHKTDSPDIGLEHLKTLIKQKKQSQANGEIHALLREHSQDPITLNEIGVILLSKKKYAQAEDVLEQAVYCSKTPPAAAFYNLGQIFLAKHDLDNAEKMFKNAKSQRPEKPASLALIDNSLAIISKRKGNWIQSEAYYNEALKLEPEKYPVIHYNLALLLTHMKKYDQAQDQFKTYLRLSPHGLNAKRAAIYLRSLPQPKHLGSR